MKGYVIRIILKDFSPETWRDLIIPENITFDELDSILRIVWSFTKDYDSTFILIPRNIFIMDDLKNTNLDVSYDSKTTLINDFFDKYQEIEYLYDFKDNWKFIIKIQDKIDFDKDYAIVNGFKCAYNPLEDCGGLWEFSELIFYAQNPDKKDSSIVSNLSENLKIFDIENVKMQLKNKLW